MGLSVECISMLQFMDKPAFISDDAVIIHVNNEAKLLGITENQPLCELFEDAINENEMCTKIINGISYMIASSELGSYKLYTLDKSLQEQQLLSLLRAAQHLRMPLGALTSSVNSIAEQVYQAGNNEAISIIQKATKQLYMLHRTVRNMSDASNYLKEQYHKTEQVNVFEYIQELCEKLSTTFENSNVRITYAIAQDDVYCNINTALLERAVYNMISNSLKADSTNIHITFKKTGKSLQLIVTDNGHGLSIEEKAQILSKFKKQPTLNFENRGLGVGMLIIQAAAIAHNGTLLLADAEPQGCKITLTMEISMDTPSLKQTPKLITVDPMGGVDTLLIELADFLPSEIF